MASLLGPGAGLDEGLGPTWRNLRALTAARVGLGRTGAAICTRDQLVFQLDHAAARDAVQTQLNAAAMVDELGARGWDAMAPLRSACAVEQGGGRREYLQRPDLGRRLGEESARALGEAGAGLGTVPEVVLVIVDGLSALAVKRHALPLLDALGEGWPRGPVCVVNDGRVAIGDEIGQILGAALSVVLIGERPGLSAPDSMGMYVTWGPRLGRTDAERNCVSNIRAGGLSYCEAAGRLKLIARRAKELGGTGVGVKGGPCGLLGFAE